MLKEHDNEYNLELRFKPKHRQRVNTAKGIRTIKNWDYQMEDKYGFITLGDLVLPEHNEKNPTIDDIKKLHDTVKSSNKFNFMGSQIQIVSQLKPYGIFI